jgi:hypothetical protein
LLEIDIVPQILLDGTGQATDLHRRSNAVGRFPLGC